MKNFHGPYFKSPDADIWHWRKDCPDFPQIVNPEWMICNRPLEESSLCRKCAQLKTREEETCLHDTSKFKNVNKL